MGGLNARYAFSRRPDAGTCVQSIGHGAMKCCAALLTPPGRGAIATVVVDGPDADQAVAQHFVRPQGRRRDGRLRAEAASAPPYQARAVCVSGSFHYGHWGSDLREEVVLYRRGDDVFEIHCHGGRAAPAAVLASLEELGCELLDWEQYLARTETSRLRAEAIRALAAATTERAAEILLDQLNGALEREVRAIRASLAVLRAMDGGSEPEASEADSERCKNVNVVEALHLAQPWKVVIAGRPNVGKSTLINALVGYERAITSALPGTTRDVVTAQAALDGWPVELIDTAGLRRSDDELEQAGVQRADAAMREADLRVLVFDRSEALDAFDRELLRAWPEAICVANKCDLPSADDPALPVGAWNVCALSGKGVDELARGLADRLVPDVPIAGIGVPFTNRQKRHLRRARGSVETRDWQRAAEAVQALLDR
jgi:tRNA modification GTPase